MVKSLPSHRQGLWPSNTWLTMTHSTRSSSIWVPISPRSDSNPSMTTWPTVWCRHMMMVLPKPDSRSTSSAPLVKRRRAPTPSLLLLTRMRIRTISKALTPSWVHHQSRLWLRSFSSRKRNLVQDHHHARVKSTSSRSKSSSDTSPPWSMIIPNASSSSCFKGRKPRRWEEKLMKHSSNLKSFSSSASSTMMMNHTTTLMMQTSSHQLHNLMPTSETQLPLMFITDTIVNRFTLYWYQVINLMCL